MLAMNDDALFALAIDNYEELNGATHQPFPHHPRHLLQDLPGLHHQKQTMRFNKRVLLLFRNQLRQTQKFCVKLWEDWKSHTEQATNITIGQITQLSTADLQLWMSKFVSEIRKRDGNK